jgi:uncharacterized membrane protein/mono/diheme cytochrome c family protein
MEQETSDIVIFLGRFHPIILHLPIGFLFITFVLEILSRFKKYRQYKPAVGFTLLLGAASAVVAAILGYMLAQAGGYNEELLSVHQWSGITVAAFSVVAYLLYHLSQYKASVALDRAYMGTLSVMAIALIVAGHYGGSLTHGSEYLTQYMPNSLRTIAGLPAKEQRGFQKITNLNEAVVFDNIIYPILDARCVSCHNDSKRKGELMMHTKEALLKGGENGPIFLAGNVKESEMLRRIHLPENHDDHMPPDGKSQLTDEQVELLAWWIAEGASFDKKVAEVQVDEQVQAILNTLVDPDANKSEVEKMLSSGVTPADEQMLSQLQHAGVLVEPLAAKVHWLQANVSQGDSGDSLVDNLSKVSEQLTWLDLGGTTTTDKALAAIGKFKNLTRLHLEKTEVTDEGLQHLKELPYLEYLNLYGTKVSDEGIQQLAGLKNLKRLYVWQTQVTRQGALQLQETLPGLEVNTGLGSDKEDDTVKAAEATVKNEDSAIPEKNIAKK